MADVATPADAINVWSAKPLPILQASRNHIISMVRRADRIKPAEIADVVLQDPLFTAQLLRVVNQREKNSLSADIASVESAILLIGVHPFLDRFARHTTVESLLLPDLQNEYAQLLKWVFHSRVLRRLSKEFAKQRYDAKVDEVQVSALLSNLVNILPLISKAPSIGLSSCKVDLVRLLKAWQYPHTIYDLLGTMAEPTPRYALQKAVLPLLDCLDKGWWGDDLQPLLNTIGLVLDQPIESVWHTITKHLLKLSQDMGEQAAFFTPARWLVMLPGAWPQERQAIAVEPKKAMTIERDVLAERMQALHLAGLQGAPTNQVMSLAIRAIADGLGMNRIAFALFMAAENKLRTRYVHGSEQTDVLRQMVISLEEPHIFTRMLQKQSSIWLNASNLVQYQPLLPAEFRDQLDVKSFCAMSIFVGDRPLGVLYADAGGLAQVSEHQYQYFKQISTLTCRALAHNARRKNAASI
ncbi:HDOD domain-containing protein [Chitinibacter bivalviorum]|uniref:HDOD domain-containing protein n=1 Tax=Chitinibacter bivalviorum TaxID=2739434 RepID=A0A7H9BGY2_9NEIS|nr:HDOD domain-containing protein [Chitinibacter bivalviorum]QLG87877.1 HDOD domain-containing protein [Chitinibacter bivalviorum]